MELICVADYEEKVKEVLDKNAFDYYRSGAGDEFTVKLNRTAFTRIRIIPRFLRDVSQVNTECEILGIKLKWPFGISPTAMQKMAHPDGEIGNAKAAGNSGCLFILGTISTTPIEEVAASTLNTQKWFQLYIYKDRVLTETLVRRAEAAGFKAIVLTVDSSIIGFRRNDIKNKFSLPSHLRLANFTGALAEGVRSMEGSSGLTEYVAKQLDLTVTWKDVEWLVKFTKLPVVVKGILSPDDAILAAQYGCKGIIISNHGGRQLDGVPATIEILPRIVKAVGNQIVVMMDGGISQGTDVFKAIALGAKLVLIGRPAVWGLAVGGQKGVEHVLDIIRKDFELTMKLTGCASLSDITSNMVAHEMSFTKL